LFIVGDPTSAFIGKTCGGFSRLRCPRSWPLPQAAHQLPPTHRGKPRAWATAVLQGLDFDDLDAAATPASDYRIAASRAREHPLVQGFGGFRRRAALLVEKTLLRSSKEQGSLSGTARDRCTQKSGRELNGLLERGRLPPPVGSRPGESD